jgi:hypothetical protein
MAMVCAALGHYKKNMQAIQIAINERDYFECYNHFSPKLSVYYNQ